MQKVKGSHRKASSVCPRPGCDAPISSQGLCQHHCDELNKQQAEIAARRTGGGFFNYKQPPPRCEEKMPRKPDEEMPRAMRAAAEKKPRGNEDMPRSTRAEPTWRDRERKRRMVEADWRDTLDDLEKRPARYSATLHPRPAGRLQGPAPTPARLPERWRQRHRRHAAMAGRRTHPGRPPASHSSSTTRRAR